MEKKINWKKVAVTAGVFATGIAIGAIGTEKILNYISLKDICEIEVKDFVEDGKTRFLFTLTSCKTGRKLRAFCTKEFIESVVKLSEGSVDDLGLSELMDIIFH